MAELSKKIITFLIFVYFVVFIFGQIPGFIFNLEYPHLPTLHLADAVVVLIWVLTLLNFHAFYTKFKLKKYIFTLIVILVFSQIISVAVNAGLYIPGLLYLVRFIAYINMIAVSRTIFSSKPKKTLLLQSLLTISVAIALLGWVQYVAIPDLTTLRLLMWDDHYYRLVSTFLDPTFTGILLVFGVIISVNFWTTTKKSLYIPITLLLLISLGFTYSRSSFLALFLALVYMICRRVKGRNILYALLILMVSASSILLLPRGSGGEGVRLERVASIMLKIENSHQAIEVFSQQPLFGVGYNNICSINTGKMINEIYSHSCSGFDNGLLMILASTGIIGTLSFGALGLALWSRSTHDIYGEIWKATIIAMGTHSLFTNTLFYAWVMGWVFLLSGIAAKK